MNRPMQPSRRSNVNSSSSRTGSKPRPPPHAQQQPSPPSPAQQQQQQRRPQPQRQQHQQQQHDDGSPAASAAAPAERGEWLAKALASCGVASRRSCIELVKAGKVTVNGRVVTDPATKVDPASDSLAVEGRRISAAAAAAASRPCYFAVNKPPGFICSNVSKQPGKRAVDLLQPWLDQWQQQHKGQMPPRLFTVGRLDVATSGLLLITNDGDWANQVIHPSADITKEYWVTLPQAPTPQQLQLLSAGTVIEGVQVTPKAVRVVNASSSSSGTEQASARGGGGGAGSSRGAARRGGSSGRCVVQLDVSEGKKHEVRLLVAAAGLELLQLQRVRVGGFVMPHRLRPGQFMELSAAMRQQVLSSSSRSSSSRHTK